MDDAVLPLLTMALGVVLLAAHRPLGRLAARSGGSEDGNRILLALGGFSLVVTGAFLLLLA